MKSFIRMIYNRLGITCADLVQIGSHCTKTSAGVMARPGLKTKRES